MDFLAAHKRFQVYGSEYPQKGRQFDRLRFGQAHHVERIYIVAQDQRTARPRSPRQALLAKGKLPASHIEAEVAIHHGNPVDGVERLGGTDRHEVAFGNHLARSVAQGRSIRRVLKLAAKVEKHPSGSEVGGKARDEIGSPAEWPPVVVGVRLAEVVAVRQHRPAGADHTGIGRGQCRRAVGVARLQFRFPVKLPRQRRQQRLRLFVDPSRVTRRRLRKLIVHLRVRNIVRLGDQPRTFGPRPRFCSLEPAVDITQCLQPLDRRIHPTVERHIRRTHAFRRRVFAGAKHLTKRRPVRAARFLPAQFGAGSARIDVLRNHVTRQAPDEHVRRKVLVRPYARKTHQRRQAVGSDLGQRPGIFVRHHAGDGPGCRRVLGGKGGAPALEKWTAAVALEGTLPPQ